VNSAARNALIALGLPYLRIRLRRADTQIDEFQWRMSKLLEFRRNLGMLRAFGWLIARVAMRASKGFCDWFQ
jgi:hypothetical protein